MSEKTAGETFELVIFELKTKTKKREGYYAASTNPFALTAYGKSMEEAEKRAQLAVELLLSRYSDTSKKLKDYLNHKAVKFTFQTTEQSARHPIAHECRRKMQVKVPTGA